MSEKAVMPEEPKATKAALLRDCDDADRPNGVSVNDGRTRAASVRIRCLIAHYDLLRAYATALREENERLSKDAERYRWLRENPNFMGWDTDFMANQVDAAIDAAKGDGNG